VDPENPEMKMDDYLEDRIEQQQQHGQVQYSLTAAHNLICKRRIILLLNFYSKVVNLVATKWL
jgi:hypothetical protein